MLCERCNQEEANSAASTAPKSNSFFLVSNVVHFGQWGVEKKPFQTLLSRALYYSDNDLTKSSLCRKDGGSFECVWRS